ncbi:hypothetical protein KMZ32_16470 [Phycicoccus sp. MAQZ13P-2]|uniref:hypothetical protein n=1 Tax=Phycicoccus mangrovi TaxID=2840470 RepID=UPI001C005457|nr:hypothetical protein [Phycicoccus mangrovi]MBT9257452.1 hypothetical protein [Phycicoccus mangrovi]MBT9275673.1 hypothetical protein [Phycicoccus mangrovi]
MSHTTLAGVVATQHRRLREMVADVARAAPGARDAALHRLLRHLAVHLAAERVALAADGVAGAGDAVEEHEIVEGAERLDDLGTDCPSFAVQLGLLAAGMVHHETRSEREVVPRFVTAQEAGDLDRAEQLLLRCDDIAVLDEDALPGVGFGHMLRDARAAVNERARLPS